MKITGKTKIVGIFGFPVSHTLSPLIQNVAFQEAGLDFVYVPFQVKSSDLRKATEAIRVFDIVGVNVTIPHKEGIIDYLDEISEEVKLIGAVNTVVNKGGKLVGYNTDWMGFLESLREDGVSLKEKKAFLIGAGGAALSLGFALVKEGVKTLFLTNRTYSRAENLARKLKEIKGDETEIKVVEFEKKEKLASEGIDILINATSLGMKEKDPPLIDLTGFPPSLYVYDVIYNRETELLKEAKKLGMRCQGGLGMLIYQGASAFWLWTGKKAPIEKMKAVARDYLGV
ncbi:MAG TPA: shikimate dehydrogenase [Candidatus Aerophobetes bacterium]|uniref:Shikimate dehydrogenase (NADP(+)) n=1 Tax=Aerophobetes bacterium TaxID=2030807 RepID=A0A7V5I0R9_UNCAE|nr:shikimate dehydrogenase [Candidatus Aerophobetes bacterium]